MQEEVFILGLTCIELFNNMKTVKILFLVAIGTLVVSCESNTYSEVSGFVANPTYEGKIKKIMAAQCTSCHGINGTRPDSPLETYQEVVDQADNIACRLDGSSCGLMPQSGKLPQVQIDMFNAWIAQGLIQQ